LDTNTMLMVTMAVFIVAIVYNQQKFKNMMLCTFIRSNRTKIEKWVPMDAKAVLFKDKYGTGRYTVVPERVVMQWYDRGLNKMFPIFIPTLEFKWDSEYPIDPNTFTNTWRSPELVNAAWQEHSQMAFSKGAAAQGGAKKKYPEWLFPMITIGAVLVIGYLVWQMSGQVSMLQRLIAARG
jgi:hypothetical protein